MERTPKQQNLIHLAEAKGSDVDLLFLNKLQDIDDTLKDIKDKETLEIPQTIFPKVQKVSIEGINVITLKGDDGHTPTDAELTSLILPLIPEPIAGRTPTKEELLALIRPLIPKGAEMPSEARLLSLIESLIPPAIVIDEIALANTVERKVEENLPKLGTAVRDALELLNGEERLNVSAIEGIEQMLAQVKDAVKSGGGRIGWGAHPITIQQSGTTKAKNARFINFTGATVSVSATGVITVAITGGSGYTKETPTGTVDGINTTFTVTSAPVYIVIDGITYFENNGYTIVGTTITTTVAPTGFIRSFY